MPQPWPQAAEAFETCIWHDWPHEPEHCEDAAAGCMLHELPHCDAVCDPHALPQAAEAVDPCIWHDWPHAAAAFVACIWHDWPHEPEHCEDAAAGCMPHELPHCDAVCDPQALPHDAEAVDPCIWHDWPQAAAALVACISHDWPHEPDTCRRAGWVPSRTSSTSRSMASASIAISHDPQSPEHASPSFFSQDVAGAFSAFTAIVIPLAFGGAGASHAFSAAGATTFTAVA